MRINSIICFKGKPANYLKIDDTASRSAQPMKEDFQWLKENGVTDIINFRTMTVSGLDFDEKTAVEENGMKYHTLPSYSKNPKEENVIKFLNIVDDVKKKGGKVQLVGFGTFEVSERAAREGRNPRSGETMSIPASKMPKFKAGKALKDMVNE